MKGKVLFSLIKVELYQIFTSLVSSRSRKTKATWLTFLSFILPIVLCLYMTGVYTFALVQYLVHANATEYRYLALVLGAVMATGIVFVLTFYHASAHLFQFKDYDLLMSLPIPNSAIMVSKLLAFYLYNYFFTLFLMLAPIYGYIKMGPVTPMFFVYALLGSFVLPVVPLVISAIIAFLITFLASRFKYRNRMTTLISFIVIMLIMLVSFRMNEVILALAARVDEIMPALAKFYPPIYYYVVSMHELSMIDLLIILGSSILLGLVFVTVFARSFKWLNSAIRMSKTSSAKRYDEKKIMRTGVFQSLVQKEVYRYLNSHSYILNTLVGPVLAVVGTVYMFIQSPENLEVALSIPGFAQHLLPMLIAMMAMLSVTSTTTASSISLEGKYFWIIKTLPVDINMIFLSKIALNLLVLVPILSLLSIGLSIRFGFTLIQLFLLLGFVIVSAFFVSLIGLISNLHFPKMDWVNEISVVKQSVAVLISMAGGAAVFGGMIYCYIKLGMSIQTELGLGICLLILIVLCVALWQYLQTVGKKLFRAI